MMNAPPTPLATSRRLSEGHLRLPGYIGVLGLWHIRKHVARIELNGARRFTTSDYTALSSYITERLKVGEVPTGSFSIKDEPDASVEHVSVAVFKN